MEHPWIGPGRRRWLAAVLTVFLSVLTAAQTTGENGIAAYKAGKIDEAIVFLQKAVDAGDQTPKVRDYYIKACTEKAMAYFDQNQLGLALKLLENARKASPGNQEIETLYSMTREAWEKEKQAQVVRAKQAAQAKKKRVSAATSVPTAVAETADLPAEEATAIPVAGEPTVVTEAVPAAVTWTATAMADIKEQFKSAIQTQQRSIEEVVEARVQSTLVTVAMVGSGVAVVILLSIILIVSRQRKRTTDREHDFLTKINDLELALANKTENTAAPSVEEVKGQISIQELRERISSVSPQTRAKGVELLGRVLVKEKTVREDALRILEPFSRDGDFRVRCQVAKTLYHFDREMALKILRDMVLGRSDIIRIAAVWACAQLEDPGMADWAYDLMMEGPDPVVRDKIKATFIEAFPGYVPPKEPRPKKSPMAPVAPSPAETPVKTPAKTPARSDIEELQIKKRHEEVAVLKKQLSSLAGAKVQTDRGLQSGKETPHKRKLDELKILLNQAGTAEAQEDLHFLNQELTIIHEEIGIVEEEADQQRNFIEMLEKATQEKEISYFKAKKELEDKIALILEKSGLGADPGMESEKVMVTEADKIRDHIRLEEAHELDTLKKELSMKDAHLKQLREVDRKITLKIAEKERGVPGVEPAKPLPPSGPGPAVPPEGGGKFI